MRIHGLPKLVRIGLMAMVVSNGVTCYSVGAQEQPSRGPITTGTLPRALHEASGFAASRRTPELLWVHNDRGSRPVLYAVSPDGTLRGVVRVTGAAATDWEDLASFELEALRGS
jgi:hypothetical protein